MICDFSAGLGPNYSRCSWRSTCRWPTRRAPTVLSHHELTHPHHPHRKPGADSGSDPARAGQLWSGHHLSNQVRTGVGGLAPVAGADYLTVRNLLLKEQRISTIFEASADRTIALRMYHLEAAADTTWGAADLHTTVVPVELAEISGRNNNYSLTCSP